MTPGCLAATLFLGLVAYDERGRVMPITPSPVMPHPERILVK
jgi:hypothetical protein